MSDIKFDFRLDKLINAIAYFSDQNIGGLTKLKIAKLLYFADKKHLLSFGRPILGDVYWCMDFGPVPCLSMNEMNEAITKSEVETEDYNSMRDALRVKTLFAKYPHFEAKHPSNLSVFEANEIRVLAEVANQYGSKTANQLVDLTHQDATWQIANHGRSRGGRTLIPYELFFEGAPASARKHLARLKADFSGEILPLDSDADYSEFSAGLRSFEFEPEFDLDKDHARNRTTA